MGKEDLGNKITPGAHSGFAEYVPQVALHGVHGDHQMVSDVDGREPCKMSLVNCCSRSVRPYADISRGVIRLGWAGSTITATR